MARKPRRGALTIQRLILLSMPLTERFCSSLTFSGSETSRTLSGAALLASQAKSMNSRKDCISSPIRAGRLVLAHRAAGVHDVPDGPGRLVEQPAWHPAWLSWSVPGRQPSYLPCPEAVRALGIFDPASGQNIIEKGQEDGGFSCQIGCGIIDERKGAGV